MVKTVPGRAINSSARTCPQRSVFKDAPSAPPKTELNAGVFKTGVALRGTAYEAALAVLARQQINQKTSGMSFFMPLAGDYPVPAEPTPSGRRSGAGQRADP